MVLLKEVMDHTLTGINVAVSNPYGMPGGLFQVGEHAYITVFITNNTGSLLKDFFIRILVSGAARIVPVVMSPGTFTPEMFEELLDRQDGVRLFDGDFSWDIIEPSDTKEIVLRIYGQEEGEYNVKANISTEIIPRASGLRADRTFRVYRAGRG
jgi:hypothetical protein